jgi:hypothetical protein
MLRGLWFVVSMMACVALAATANAKDSLVACCSPLSDSCQLITETQCTDAKGIVEGTSCTNVRCTGCCEGIAGNPNACSSSYNIVLCLESTGTPMLNAHCESTGTAMTCVADPAAPAVRAPVAAGVAIVLAIAGVLLVRRRAHSRT